MKAIGRLTTAATIGSATTAFAASGAENDGMGLLTILFLGFGALIITLQLFPGVLLFVSMLKGAFSKGEPAQAQAASNRNR
ncbi:hypothetical protein [Geobacter sp. DSM 9736]|uniref:hypothetical protein n=1 Tax=Geobacter sp. DSM 9736 TaxID=1277350 RepID=UPI000B50BC2B|nr:hypothetical protein [Geobacter sp. DSM 9736]SNB47954.1 hypothetical protein SAMN06269301_3448 [Geobacter sp. DSM 9736]